MLIVQRGCSEIASTMLTLNVLKPLLVNMSLVSVQATDLRELLVTLITVVVEFIITDTLFLHSLSLVSFQVHLVGRVEPKRRTAFLARVRSLFGVLYSVILENSDREKSFVAKITRMFSYMPL